MSNRDEKQRRAPLEVWLPPLVLKFLVFLVFTCVIAGAMVGLLQGDLSTNRLWIILGGMVALLLLLAIDRLTSLKVSPGGVEATLAEVREKALEEVALLEDRDVAQAARAKILEARNRGEVEGAMAVAMRLNVTKVVERVQQAIGERRKVYIRYMPEPGSPLQAYQAAPLDIKPGKTARTQSYDYLWVYSYEHEHILSLRLERVLGVELSEETFDPADVTGAWREAWNVERDWDMPEK